MARYKKPLLGLIGIGTVLLLVIYPSAKLKNNRGEMGIGTLIIFLAVVLVAAIAASVLISTGSSLQQRALITGNEAREGVSTNMEVVSVKGSDSSSGGTPHLIEHLMVNVRLAAGSSPIKMNSTVMTIDTPIISQNFVFGGTVGDSTLATGTDNYVISYIKSGPYQQNNTLNTGDFVKIKFNVEGGMGENQRAKISIVPHAGGVTQIEFQTPDIMIEPVVGLWPTS